MRHARTSPEAQAAAYARLPGAWWHKALARGEGSEAARQGFLAGWNARGAGLLGTMTMAPLTQSDLASIRSLAHAQGFIRRLGAFERRLASCTPPQPEEGLPADEARLPADERSMPEEGA